MTKTQSAQSTQSQDNQLAHDMNDLVERLSAPLLIEAAGISIRNALHCVDEIERLQRDTKDIPATQVAQGWGVETRDKVARLEADLYSLTLRVGALQSIVRGLTQERDAREAEAQERTRAEYQERMDLGI